ncbi:MAG: Smr/MutS family protein [Caldimicrobium sp.]
MPKPFQKLGEILGISPSKSSIIQDNFPFKVNSWEELLHSVKPLREKNFHFCLNPKRPYWFKEKEWPPSKIEVQFHLTSEYMEGKKRGVPSEILWKLRNGGFSVQASLNLRGYLVEEAKLLFEDFIRSAINKGLTCVLIIHGRGLSSKEKPVLKEKVREWLERGPYRKYILAYASARPCDGGPGATYVLLAQRPVKK